MLLITELVWDDRNEAHIARHGIPRHEVEEVCFGRHWLLRSKRRNRKALFGQTLGGRYLLVIVEMRGRGVYYPVTARDMNAMEGRRFRIWRGRR